ncbi:MAG: hypothetical protein C4560_09510 [Nitrospiraceae bacterium]|nr:MAG: hypothetical protein C4560_09510 [Nitrospiraceae bacterium]
MSKPAPFFRLILVPHATPQPGMQGQRREAVLICLPEGLNVLPIIKTNIPIISHLSKMTGMISPQLETY